MIYKWPVYLTLFNRIFKNGQDEKKKMVKMVNFMYVLPKFLKIELDVQNMQNRYAKIFL